MAKPTSVNTDFIPMATGAKGRSPGSAGNIMPGPSALGGPSGGIRGGGSGLGANPARNGMPPISTGQPFHTAGAPAQNSPPTSGTMPMKALGGPSKASLAMLAHGRTLGAVAHLTKTFGDHPHLKSLHAKATAGIKSSTKKQGLTKGPSFGSIGGSQGTGMASPGGIPSVGQAAPGAAPTGMGPIDPDGVM